MQKFKYKGIDSNTCKTEKGYIEALDYSSAKKLLNDKGIVIESLEENNSFSNKLFKKEKSYDFRYTKYLPDITSELGDLLEQGVTLTESLEVLSKLFKNKKLKKIFLELKRDVEQGSTLHSAFRKHTDIFPKLLIDMVEVGETLGDLPNVLKKISITYSKNRELKNKLITMMIYPIITGLVAIGIIGFMLVYVFPKMAVLYTSFDDELPLITQLVITVSEFTFNNLSSILLITLIGFLVFIQMLKLPKFKKVIDSLLLKIPFFGKFISLYNTTLFSRVYSMLYKSGIESQVSLSICSNIINNLVIKDRINNIKEGIEKGKNMSSLAKENKFDSYFSKMIEIGEKTGNIDIKLEGVANKFQEKIDTSTKRLSVIIEPMMIVIIGGIVGFLVLAMYLPIVNMTQLIM